MAKTTKASLEGDFERVGALRISRTAKTVAIDSADLESPQNVYDADLTWVELSPSGTVSLFFAKMARGRQALKSRLEIRYPPEDFLNHLWKNSRDFHGRLKSYVARWPPVSAPSPETESWAADKEHSEWVNFDYIAHSGTEAAIDFYHMPPTGIARFNQTKKAEVLQLNPVVRVLLTSSELLRLLDRCEPIAARVDSIMPSDQKMEQLAEEGEGSRQDGILRE